jgi:hypothetical protein
MELGEMMHMIYQRLVHVLHFATVSEKVGELDANVPYQGEI